MAVFHLFPCLPFELRARIWELTIEPRTVEVVHYKNVNTNLLHVVSPTPVPPILQACHEARTQKALYQKAFTLGSEPRYVWVNFEIDMISIGDTVIDLFKPEQQLIRRLTIEEEYSDYFFYSKSRDLYDFCNVEEIHVICRGGLQDWKVDWENIYWPCPKTNLKLIDKETGQGFTGEELDSMWKWPDEESTSE
ncbi:hypothetical protein MaudCBS49596_007541 [Microsporum audouinii]